ncbi:mas-related G-protein coupled receptor MRG-like [Scomber japonicus]|uniref:mas-related G-protein coupled receptor MRG-like n=1 Tax=Scomber japonicus TaxID=13676 RepID=UPI002306BC5A|nr:mas-related G-protein coupled receptor MRG-like [Scomber japonicus]
MEEQYSNNNTFQNNSHLDSIVFWLPIELRIVSWIVIAICLPLIIPAIYYLAFSIHVLLQVRHNHVAPIYVINLLISDLIQLSCMAIFLGNPKGVLFFISDVIHIIGVMASVGFMMICVSILYYRYLLIAWPLWYRFRRTVKVSVVVCVVVWVLALVLTFLPMFIAIGLDTYAVMILLPFPVLIFSVVGIFKGLSAAISVSSEEKRRIVGATILVLLNYTLLFLPYLIYGITKDYTMTDPFAFLFFNPLGDLVLYIFMRKGAIDKILASLCCCRMETQQQQIIAVNDNNMTTVSSV